MNKYKASVKVLKEFLNRFEESDLIDLEIANTNELSDKELRKNINILILKNNRKECQMYIESVGQTLKFRNLKTRDGKNVRIICSDRKDGKDNYYASPIIALITERKGLESLRSYNKEGLFNPGSGLVSKYDLIFPLKENINPIIESKVSWSEFKKLVSKGKKGEQERGFLNTLQKVITVKRNEK